MNFNCINDLGIFLGDHFLKDPTAKPILVTPEPCPPGMEGDLTVNCFRLARDLRSKPELIAEKALEFLLKRSDIKNAVQIKAFVNITLKAEVLFNETIGDTDSLLADVYVEKAKRKKYLIEYSAPNTNKPLHLGHLRNNALGMGLTSLLRRVGHDVSAVNLINDRGIHICKSMIGYERFGKETTPEGTGRKGDHFVGDFYVLYDKELKRQIKELREQNNDLSELTDDELFIKTEIGNAAQQILIKWENNDPEVRKLWKTMNDWVISGFDETYKRMGVEFDKVYFESDTYTSGKNIVIKGYEDGLFKKNEDGSIFADLDKFKLGKKILLRADGTSVYITQDIGTSLKKYEDFRSDSLIWVVGDEQIHHFNTLFAILKVLGHKWADDLHHLAYGMVNLPSGKMKSREGTVVDADNLFDEMVELSKQATLERCGENIPDDIDRRSEIVGLGALKFMLLKFNPKTTIMFDPGASVKFEGDTGPYVQYVCARINSILRKAEEKDIEFSVGEKLDWELLDTKWERELAMCASFYPKTLQFAAEKLDCSTLISYLINLAKTFNAFYRECPVLSANDDIRAARLTLCKAIREVLEDGLNTLTIDVPDAM